MKWNDRTYRNLTRFGCYSLALGLCVFFAIEKPKDFSPTWFGAVALLLVYAGIVAGQKPAKTKDKATDEPRREPGDGGGSESHIDLTTLSKREKLILEAWIRVREHSAAAEDDEPIERNNRSGRARHLWDLVVLRVLVATRLPKRRNTAGGGQGQDRNPPAFV